MGKCLNGKLTPQYGFDIKKKSLMESKRKYKAWRSTLVRTP